MAHAATVEVDHNGSGMHVDRLGPRVIISYARPRPDLLRAGVRPGTVLFEGDLGSGRIRGTAYTFKEGCPPAAYTVEGSREGNDIVLRGAAPRRDPWSCAVIGTNEASPHALLRFALRDQVAAATFPSERPEEQSRTRWAAAAERIVRSAEGFDNKMSDTSAVGAAPSERVLPPRPVIPQSGPTGMQQPDSPKPATDGAAVVEKAQEQRSTDATAQPQQSHAIPPLATFDLLVNGYVAQYPALREDAAFAVDLARMDQCDAFRRAGQDEFSIARFRKAALETLKAQGPGTHNVRLRVPGTLGAYDFDRHEFAFSPVSERTPIVLGRESVAACGATHKDLPTAIFMTLRNAGLTNGLEMTPEDAEAYLKSHRQAFGGAPRRDVVVELTVELGDFGPAHPFVGEPPYRPSYNASTVEGTITGVDVFADATSATPFYTMSPERKERYGATMAAAAAADEADKRVNQDFNATVLADQVARLKRGEDLCGGKRTRFSQVVILGVGADSPHTVQPPVVTNVSPTDDHEDLIRLDNASEATGVAVPDKIKQAAKDRSVRASMLYVPIGVLDDGAVSQTILVAHVAAVEFSTETGDGIVREAVPMRSEAKPLSLSIDERPASAFDVVGINVREEPDTVREKLQRAFGDPVVYDEATGTMRTALPRCERGPAAAISDEPPFGSDANGRCVFARFATVGHTLFGRARPGLIRLEIEQTFVQGGATAMLEALSAKYGEPRAAKPVGKGGTAVWGARLVENRMAANLGLHAVSVEWTGRGPAGDATRFILSDPLSVGPSEASDAQEPTKQVVRF